MVGPDQDRPGEVGALTCSGVAFWEDRSRDVGQAVRSPYRRAASRTWAGAVVLSCQAVVPAFLAADPAFLEAWVLAFREGVDPHGTSVEVHLSGTAEDPAVCNRKYDLVRKRHTSKQIRAVLDIDICRQWTTAPLGLEILWSCQI